MTPHEQLYTTQSPTRLFFRCALPSMLSMAMTALYTVADGFFVGHFIGMEALAAVNLVMPPIMMSFALSDMLAVGSSVQIAIRLGEKKEREASRIFSVCTLLIIGIACLIGLAGYTLAQPLLRLMGADPTVTGLAVKYLRIYALFAPVITVFFAVDNYLRICGKIRYSMGLNVGISLLNILLDCLFVGVLHWGVEAAALASCLSLALGTVLGFAPFLRHKLALRFTRGGIPLALLGNILANGSSEFFSNIAGSLLMLVLNSVLLRISGAMAVAAFSIVLYVDSIVASLLYGLSDAMQPAISYCYGAGLRRRMFALEKRVLAACAAISLAALVWMQWGGHSVISLFVADGTADLLEMSVNAMRLFSLSYLTGWLGTSLSAFFTAVNRPGLSLTLALCRALVFPLIALAILPSFLGLNGVWLAPPVGCALTAALALMLMARILRRDRSAALQ